MIYYKFLGLPVKEFQQELSSCWDWRSFGHNRHGLKSGRGMLCPFPWGTAGSPSNTVSPGP